MNFILAKVWKPGIKQQEENLCLDGEPKGILRSFPLLISPAIIISHSSCSLHSLSWPKYLITSSVYNLVSSAETETKKRHDISFWNIPLPSNRNMRMKLFNISCRAYGPQSSEGFVKRFDELDHTITLLSMGKLRKGETVSWTQVYSGRKRRSSVHVVWRWVECLTDHHC